ncbi:oxysterol binding family protein [Cavenderia fasciculata]|uniref:Oxysterol binding family protein n=1 Tax=Cavenderia fasciculata TaxID=261658 RepID=F4PRN8_CACFS|nr:oxysterol binding family protein [Cavenderia fasciculata]EGG20537.1 oxysterol binding family protein [Cavenderia fasciculata]|eukprot:XP_004358387.1 oxysterol binding family protein [Cavenderia fasciculata]
MDPLIVENQPQPPQQQQETFPPSPPPESSSPLEQYSEEIKNGNAEVLEEEPRNLLLSVLSEIKIGMDLSTVPLPTFILESRSLLEKFTDFMVHCDQLHNVHTLIDPMDRMLAVSKWYLSGFSYTPKGVKKPYNPILGEIFRAKWQYHDTTTQLIAEQVCHHPPISCIYISNRKDGYVVTGTISPRGSYQITSLVVHVEGTITLRFIETNEEYTFNFPSIYARGILFGTLMTEIAGKTSINCSSTNLRADFDFKTKPLFGGDYNEVSGKIKKKGETLYNISGKWDNRLDITSAVQKKSSSPKNAQVLWDCKNAKKTPKFIKPIPEQAENESQRLWQFVSNAITKRDQKEATAEKIKLENVQRQGVKKRKEKNIEWQPKHFIKVNDQWVYKNSNFTPYNPNEPPEIFNIDEESNN